LTSLLVERALPGGSFLVLFSLKPSHKLFGGPVPFVVLWKKSFKPGAT